MPEFLDAWGKPIEFLRWAPGLVSVKQDHDLNNPDPFDESSPLSLVGVSVLSVAVAVVLDVPAVALPPPSLSLSLALAVAVAVAVAVSSVASLPPVVFVA